MRGKRPLTLLKVGEKVSIVGKILMQQYLMLNALTLLNQQIFYVTMLDRLTEISRIGQPKIDQSQRAYRLRDTNQMQTSSTNATR